MIKAIIFDCFDVMVTDALQSIVFKSDQLIYEDKLAISKLLIAANKGLIHGDEYRSKAAEILKISLEEYKKLVSDREVINTELLEYAGQLRKKYKVGMLSNVSSLDSLKSRFHKGELEKYFDCVIASAEIGYAKPEAQAYEIAAENLGVRLDECVMIDDRLDYCQGAEGVGMTTIQFVSNDQTKKELNKILAKNNH